ncbi:MAG: hypothetical protein GWO86_02715 [Planctomycetes bacterium]|nr:hypothetical protein [Planctomycetota bacterium]
MILYKNKRLESYLIVINAVVTVVVITAALLQSGFFEPLLSISMLRAIFAAATAIFIIEKIIRLFNSRSRQDYFKAGWFELLFLFAFVILYFSASFIVASGVYLLLQIVSKVCRTVVNLAASAKSPAGALVGSFAVLIICGTILLMLPKSHSSEPISFIDALFTSTSATCVTGLVVKDTGSDFSIIGQTVILVLIQLGGLGIVIFGAVFALLLGQALNVRQSVAMQDLLNARTAGRIGNIIVFIFAGTLVFEAVGAAGLYRMWDSSAGFNGDMNLRWFYSIFHSVSAFCNAGFCLFNDSLIHYSNRTALYLVICPLIIFGGLGFGVLHNLFCIGCDRIKRFVRKTAGLKKTLLSRPARCMQLQTKIVLTVSLILILAGTAAIWLFSGRDIGIGNAFFQSVTARTAGFNTIDIKSMPAPGKIILMVLMFIGGSPASTAGGIKTVTLAIIVMAAYSTIRKRSEVEIFNRSIHTAIVGKALTVVLMFIFVLLSAILLLSLTEKQNGFDMSQIIFEAASALGTVGLSCGITPSLTTAGKIIIIITMLIGRLGPLTLLAMLTFNLKPVRYNYPAEAVVVG